jgi:cytochrome c553
MRILTALALLLVVAPCVHAEDARVLAAGCAGCHGTNGHAVGGMSVLAGAKPGSVRARMLDFRAGRRAGTVMPQLAKGYTDAEIDALDLWFAAQPADAPARR